MTERPPYFFSSVTMIIDVTTFIFDVCSSFRYFVVTKYHRLGSLGKTETYSSWFWKLEVQDTSMVGLFQAADFLLSPPRQKGLGSLWNPLYETTNPLYEGFALMA